MYMPPYIVQALHEDRIREAQRNAQNRIAREVSEPVPTEDHAGLLSQIKQWLHHDETQPAREVRSKHAHAV